MILSKHELENEMTDPKSLHVVITLANGKEYISVEFDTRDERAELESLVRRAATDELQVMSFKARNGSWILLPNDVLKTASFELVPTYDALRPEPVFPAPERGW